MPASPFQASGETSPGKNDDLPRTIAGSTPLPLGRRSFAVSGPLAPVRSASYPVPVRRLTGSFHASFSVRLTTNALRFPSVPATRFREDFHLQVIAHAGPTTKRRARPFGRTLPVHCEPKARGGLRLFRAPPHRCRLTVDCISPTPSSFTAIARIIVSHSPPVHWPGSHMQHRPRQRHGVRPRPPRVLVVVPPDAAARAARIRTDDPGGAVHVRHPEVHPLERIAECTRASGAMALISIFTEVLEISSHPTPSDGRRRVHVVVHTAPTNELEREGALSIKAHRRRIRGPGPPRRSGQSAVVWSCSLACAGHGRPL